MKFAEKVEKGGFSIVLIKSQVGITIMKDPFVHFKKQNELN